jgi:acyl-[acyl-carrier-protein]-phospholipid O-acyltransferase/long-chain-fatty-acid--[acyl-carrier-protein] ligase
MKDKIRPSGIPALSQPSLFLQVAAIPRLGTGKADYGKAKELALSLSGA